LLPYWKTGCQYLLKNDLQFKNYYNKNHFLKLNKNKFDILFKSICSQQISVSAAMAIYQQSKKIMGTISYNKFKNQISLIEDLPLSNNKKKSIISLISNYELVQSIKFDDTFQLSPPYELTKIFGIGPWTVQMFSIFHLGISNILPIGDLGFINAYKKYYKDESLKKLNKNSNKWSKYTTIVTWYLWSSYDSEPLYL
jgi:DNA-3-methyladenine glycosylase II